MPWWISATYDGKVLRLDAPLPLKPGQRVRVSIHEEVEDTGFQEDGRTCSFLDVVQNLNLAGPPDWSTNVDEYLYEGKEWPAARSASGQDEPDP